MPLFALFTSAFAGEQGIGPPLFANSTAAPRRSTGGLTRTDFIGQTVVTGLYFQTVQHIYCLMGDSVV